MKNFRAPRLGLLLVLTAAVLSSACFVTSVRPFYFAGDVAAAAHLVGRWGAGEEEVWTLEPAGEERYLWRVAEDGGEYTLAATFFHFHGELMMDLSLGGEDYGADENVEIHTIRTHTPVRVRLEDGGLFFDLPSADFLEQSLKSGATDVDHYASPDDRIVLTGSTTELQGFLGWCLASPGCFEADPDASLKRLGQGP